MVSTCHDFWKSYIQQLASVQCWNKYVIHPTEHSVYIVPIKHYAQPVYTTSIRGQLQKV